MTNTILLTPVVKKTTPKDRYFIILEIMHGDADFYEKIKYPCKNEAEFVSKMLALADMPLASGSGGSDKIWSGFCETNFSDYIPTDKTSVGQYTACIDDYSGLYFDKNGDEFVAKIG